MIVFQSHIITAMDLCNSGNCKKRLSLISINEAKEMQINVMIEDNLNIYDKAIEQVDSFSYLESIGSKDGSANVYQESDQGSWWSFY
jgi:hypothetical protein